MGFLKGMLMLAGPMLSGSFEPSSGPEPASPSDQTILHHHEFVLVTSELPPLPESPRRVSRYPLLAEIGNHFSDTFLTK